MRRAKPDPLAALTHLDELISCGGEISIGQVASVECAAVASDEHNCLAMLQRRPDESLYQLLVRLDTAIHRAWESEYFTDEINGKD